MKSQNVKRKTPYPFPCLSFVFMHIEKFQGLCMNVVPFKPHECQCYSCLCGHTLDLCFFLIVTRSLSSLKFLYSMFLLRKDSV